MVIIIQQVQGKTVFFNYRKHLLCIQTVFCPLHNPYYLTELVHTASIYSISLNYVLLQDGVCPLSKLDTPCEFYTITNGDNQLNPARGRKQEYHFAVIHKTSLGVYAAQPREGTETGPTTPRRSRSGSGRRFMQLNPARGRKHLVCRASQPLMREVYAAQPHEGMETHATRLQLRASKAIGLCSSTPRGDGNRCTSSRRTCGWTAGLCSSTPRGDESGFCPLSGHGAALDPHAHDDTPPCSSPVSAPHAQHISSFLMGGLW